MFPHAKGFNALTHHPYVHVFLSPYLIGSTQRLRRPICVEIIFFHSTIDMSIAKGNTFDRKKILSTNEHSTNEYDGQFYY